MSKYFVYRDDCSRHQIFPGVEIFTAAGQNVMLSLVEFEPDSEVVEHSHPHEQLGLLLEGELDFVIGDERQTLTAGAMWRIPGGVVHSVKAGRRGARALDVFNPVREDYL
jgi:quercetin dioxygenase-like cupin family protein